MNKTKIEWCDMTWNPVTGCLHNCTYCYARRIANRFKGWTDSEGDTHYDTILTTDNLIRELQEPLYIAPKERLGKWPKAPYPYGFIPTFHRYRLDEPIRKTRPRKIFVCSMADLFGDWVPDEWIELVFQACEDAPQHTYMFLTKNPKKITESITRWAIKKDWWGMMPCLWWFGTTITCDEDVSRLEEMPADTNTFVSIEPLLNPVDLGSYIVWVDWVIIGQQTNPDKPPKDEWVQSIIDQCRAAGVPVFVKRPLYERFPIQEWPEGLR